MQMFRKLSRSQKIVALPPTATVMEATQCMLQKSVGSMLVMEGPNLVGIFTERDLLNRVVACGLDTAKSTLAGVMTKNVVTVEINDTLESCYEKMQQTKSRHVPIVDAGKVVGMVTMRDILEWLWQEIEEENAELKRYITS